MLGKTGKKLFSRIIRGNALDGKIGIELLTEKGENKNRIRKIDNTALTFKEDDNGGLIGWIWNAGGKFTGWLIDGVKWLGLSFVKVFGWLIGGVERLKAFNWNATDKEIKASIEARNKQLFGIWGGVAGQAFGWLAGVGLGYGIGLVVPVIGGAALAKAIASSVTTEGIEEVSDEFIYALRQTISTWAGNQTLRLYMSGRNMLRNADQKTLKRFFGEQGAKFIKEHWGKDGEPVLSFNQSMDDAVDSIPDENWKEFIEEFLDESWDGFVEAGFVIAQELDDAYAQAMKAQQDAKGPKRQLTLYPDKNSTSETITIYPQPQENAIQTANTSLNLYRQIYNKDVGEIVADAAEERIRASVTGRALHLQFHERSEPPFRLLDGSQGQRAEVRIPNPLTTLTYSQIRKKCKPYKYGRFKADLSMSSGRHINVWAESKEVALYKANELAELSMDSVINQNVWEEVETDPSRRKKNVLLYPRKGSLSQPHTPLSRQDSRDVPKKAFAPVTKKFFLWADEEPFDFPSFAIDTNLNNS